MLFRSSETQALATPARPKKKSPNYSRKDLGKALRKDTRKHSRKHSHKDSRRHNRNRASSSNPSSDADSDSSSGSHTSHRGRRHRSANLCSGSSHSRKRKRDSKESGSDHFLEYDKMRDLLPRDIFNGINLTPKWSAEKIYQVTTKKRRFLPGFSSLVQRNDTVPFSHRLDLTEGLKSLDHTAVAQVGEYIGQAARITLPGVVPPGWRREYYNDMINRFRASWENFYHRLHQPQEISSSALDQVQKRMTDHFKTRHALYKRLHKKYRNSGTKELVVHSKRQISELGEAFTTLTTLIVQRTDQVGQCSSQDTLINGYWFDFTAPFHIKSCGFEGQFCSRPSPAGSGSRAASIMSHPLAHA